MFKIDSGQLRAGKNSLHFPCNGYQLAADLYLPQDFDPEKSGDAACPAIIFARPATQTKAQASTVYGRKLSDCGYAVLAVDHIGFGESEGEIRNYEHTDNVLSALRDGISVLRMIEGVDSARIFGVGLCMGGAYITRLAYLDRRLAGFATLSAYFDNADAFAGMMDKDTRKQMIDGANQAAEKYLRTGEVDRYDVLGGLKPGAVPEQVPRYYADAVDYYLTARGGLDTAPDYSNMVPMFQYPIDPSLNHSSFAGDLDMPKLFIRGSEAATTGPLTDAFFPKAAEPKQKLVIEGAEHFDLYDIDKYVDQAIDAIDSFFRQAA